MSQHCCVCAIVIKNTERHTADTIVSRPNPKQWVIVHTSDLMTIIRHRGLVTPHGVMDRGQHWLRKWLAAWRHQAFTWTNFDLSSVRSFDIHMRAISLEIPQPSISKIRLKINYISFKFPRGQWVKSLWRQYACIIVFKAPAALVIDIKFEFKANISTLA